MTIASKSVYFLIAIMALALAGCAMLPAPTATSVATSASTSAGSKVALDDGVLDRKGPEAGKGGRYFEFDDILIPEGLSLNRDRTMLFRVGTFKAGVMTYDGRLEVASLSDFFVAAMTKDNWDFVGGFKLPEVALFFGKAERTCVINISEGPVYSHVTIWVAPTTKHALTIKPPQPK